MLRPTSVKSCTAAAASAGGASNHRGYASHSGTRATQRQELHTNERPTPFALRALPN